MIRKIAVGAVVFSLILIIVACSAPTSASVPTQKPVEIPAYTPAPAANPTPIPPSNPKPSGPIKAKWLEPQINGSTVSIPVSDLKNNWNSIFKIVKQGTTMNFMAYVFDGEIQVRGSACPPCRGITYTLNNDLLVCDTCGTTFKAKNSAGVQGPCVRYPKEAVSYKIADGNIVMNESDLVKAYQETLKVD
jgi:hypothetical protein